MTITAEPPAPAVKSITDLPNLRIHWRRAVRRDPRLGWADVMVLLEVEDHANLDGTGAHPGRNRLAERTIDHGRNRTPYTTRTVTDVLKRGRELGYLIRTEESCKLPDGSRTADEYRLGLPLDVLELAEATPKAPKADEAPKTPETAPAGADDIGGNELAVGETQTSPHQTTLHHTDKKTSEKTSAQTSVAAGAATEFVRAHDVFDRKWRTGERTPGARMIHPQWSPSNANRAVGRDLGVDTAVLAGVFHEQMAANRERRKRWGAAFTAFLRDYADNYRSSTTFGFVAADAVDAAIAKSCHDSMTAWIADYNADKAADAEASGAPPAPVLTSGVADKLRKVEKVIGALHEHERAFAMELLGDDPKRNFNELAWEIERLRDTARLAGKVA